jgi:hypothetical protein
MTPEQHLYLAVMKQAVADLVGGTKEEPHRAELVRKEAIAFFTDRVGLWADMRAEVCEAIDRDPDEVRAAIIEALDGGDLPHLGHMRGGNIEKSRDLWRAQKSQNALIEAFRAQQAAKRKPPAPKPAPPIIRKKRPTPAPVAAEPADLPLPLPPKRPIKETIRASKPWRTPPRAPEDDWLYGIAPTPN